MDKNESFGLILLAAGGSARLGRPKQLLEFRGQPLLRHAAETALASQCRPVVVVLGAEAEACADVLNGLPVRIVINADWNEGLSSSIRAGIAALESEKLAVSAAILCVADQPHLTAPLLNSLIETHRATGKKIIAAQYAGVPGPPALFCASLFDQLKTLSGDEGARRVLLANPDTVALVPFPEGSLDIDTAADYAQLSTKTPA
jgi:molybdenum cofactor cytidylyltransferase